MHTIHSAARTAIAVLASCAVLSFAPAARAQSCATTPEAGPPHVRIFADACGTAAFSVNAHERGAASLSLNVARGQAYFRSIRLVYGEGSSRVHTDMRLHRLIGERDTALSVPTRLDGRSLTSVFVDIAPPGSGTEPIVLALGDGTQNASANGGAVRGAPPTAAADKSEWILAASARANVAARRDVLEIGRQKGRFESLALSGRGGALPVQSVQVIPFDGQPFTVDLSATLAPDNWSAPIAVDPPDFVRAIVITYAAQSGQAAVQSSVVEVRGRHAESWGGQIGENRQYAGGWMLLGTVDIVVAPHQPRPAFRIAGREGAFRKLRFVARRGTIDLAGVTVDAGGGRSEQLAINTVLMPDQPSQPQGFANGAALPITTVSLAPRLRSQTRMDATLEVWAQY
jgi:hypothetical protein